MSAAMESIRVKKGRKKRSLTKWLVGGTTVDDGVNQDRILPDVDFKSFRAPSADCLYRCKVCASFCKRSGAARSHRLTGYLVGEEFAKAGDEPLTSWNGSSASEPEFRVEGKKRVSRFVT